MAYFTKDFIDFFKELAPNNSKEWFDENRSRYHESVKEPFDSFIKDLIVEMSKSNKKLAHLEPKDCVFRINRDIRFSKDKTPYKLNRSAAISPGGKKDFSTPGLYFEFTPEHVRIYTGAYQPNKEQLQAIREEIAENLSKFDKIITEPAFVEVFGEVHGEKNSRLPKELREAAEKQPLIYNKGFYIYHTMPAETILKEDLIERLLHPYEVAQPYIKFLTKPLSV